MKKLLTLALCILMAFSAILVGCSNTDANGDTTNEAATVKFGAGLYVSTPTVADATEDVEGSGKVDVTVAAVTVTADGKIAACDVDTTSNTVKFTADGKALAGEFKTKYEQGTNYGMVMYGASDKEWFEQAAAFDAACIGKTKSEIASLEGADGYGVDDLKAAGCTVAVSGFVKAATK
jgi:hypothetical protein